MDLSRISLTCNSWATRWTHRHGVALGNNSVPRALFDDLFRGLAAVDRLHFVNAALFPRSSRREEPRLIRQLQSLSLDRPGRLTPLCSCPRAECLPPSVIAAAHQCLQCHACTGMIPSAQALWQFLTVTITCGKLCSSSRRTNCTQLLHRRCTSQPAAPARTDHAQAVRHSACIKAASPHRPSLNYYILSVVFYTQY